MKASPTTITPPSVDADPPHIQQIAEFVASLPSDHLAIYVRHLTNRLCAQFEERLR